MSAAAIFGWLAIGALIAGLAWWAWWVLGLWSECREIDDDQDWWGI